MHEVEAAAVKYPVSYFLPAPLEVDQKPKNDNWVNICGCSSNSSSGSCLPVWVKVGRRHPRLVQGTHNSRVQSWLKRCEACSWSQPWWRSTTTTMISMRAPVLWLTLQRLLQRSMTRRGRGTRGQSSPGSCWPSLFSSTSSSSASSSSRGT